MAAAIPLSAWAVMMKANVGKRVMEAQLAPTNKAAMPMRNRFCLSASISAPQGVCATTVAIPIADIAMPILAGSQCCVANK